MNADHQTSESKPPAEPGLLQFVRWFGLWGALRHYSRRWLNRLHQAVANNVGRTVRIASFIPAVIGLSGGGLLVGLSPADPWWDGLWMAIGIAWALLGAALTASMFTVHLMFFRHLVGILGLCAVRLVAVAAVFAGAGLWVESFQERVTIILLAAAVAFLVRPMFRRLAHLMRWHRSQPALQRKISWDEGKYSDDHVWRIAIHEAGHAAAYGFLTTLPEDACAGISLERDTTIGGYAWGLWKNDALAVSDALIDMVLVQLAAGTMAEEQILGDRCFGDSDDMQKFDELMKFRIVHFTEDGYNSSPADDVQRAWNLRLERRHRRLIFRRARHLVQRNRDAIVKLAVQLKEREFLDCLDLIPYWTLLRLPEGVGKVDVPSTIPCLAQEQIDAHLASVPPVEAV